MDHNLYHEIEDKAQILVDSLPYIRDFNQKIIIISFGCSNILTDEEEQEVMRDIALMKSIGMRPIVVHDTITAEVTVTRHVGSRYQDGT